MLMLYGQLEVVIASSDIFRRRLSSNFEFSLQSFEITGCIEHMLLSLYISLTYLPLPLNVCIAYLLSHCSTRRCIYNVHVISSPSVTNKLLINTHQSLIATCIVVRLGLSS